MLKKLAAFLMAAAMLLTMTAAGAESAQAPVTISFYSTQAGVDDATIALLDEFMAQHPGITVNYYPCGDDQLAAWLALYSAGTAPPCRCWMWARFSTTAIICTTSIRAIPNG